MASKETKHSSKQNLAKRRGKRGEQGEFNPSIHKSKTTREPGVESKHAVYDFQPQLQTVEYQLPEEVLSPLKQGKQESLLSKINDRIEKGRNSKAKPDDKSYQKLAKELEQTKLFKSELQKQNEKLKLEINKSKENRVKQDSEFEKLQNIVKDFKLTLEEKDNEIQQLQKDNNILSNLAQEQQVSEDSMILKDKEIDKTKAQVNELYAKCALLNENNQNLTKEKEILSSSFEEVRKEYEDLKFSFENLEEKNEKLKEIIEKLENENENRKESEEKTTEEKFNTEINLLKINLLKTKKDKREALSEIDILTTKNRELENKIFSFQEQDSQVEFRVKELENELRNLKDDHHQALLSKDIQIRRLEQDLKANSQLNTKDNEHSKETIKNLETIIRNNKQEIKSLSNKFNQIRATNDEKSAKEQKEYENIIADLKTKNSKQAKMNQQLEDKFQSEIQELKDKLETEHSEKMKDTEEQTRKELEGQIRNIIETNQGLTKENDHIKSKLKDMENYGSFKQNNENSAAMLDLKTENERLASELSNTHNKMLMVSEELCAAELNFQERNSELTATIEDLHFQIQDLRSSESYKEKTINDLRISIEEDISHTQNSEFKNIIDILYKDLAKAETDNQSLMDKNIQFTQKVIQYEEEISKLSLEMNEKDAIILEEKEKTNQILLNNELVLQQLNNQISSLEDEFTHVMLSADKMMDDSQKEKDSYFYQIEELKDNCSLYETQNEYLKLSIVELMKEVSGKETLQSLETSDSQKNNLKQKLIP